MKKTAFSIDSLESRRMMADVSAVLAGNVLLVTGGATNDTVTVSVDGDNLVVSGPSVDTTSFHKWDVTSLYANLGEGNDAITVSGIDTGLVVTLDTAGGDDSAVVNNSVLHGVLVRTDTGADLVNINNATLQSLTVDTGAGDDQVYVTSVLNYNWASYTLGAGNDVLLTANGYTYGFTYVEGAADADLFTSTGDLMFGGYYVASTELVYIA